jgi:transglutaminase-like putative cysteine protease
MKLKMIVPKLFTQTPKIAVNKPAVIRLTLCLSLAIAWHIGDIPFWAIIGGLALNLWRFLHDWRGIALPGKKLKFIITVLSFAVIYLHFGNYLGRDPGICALILFSAIKLLELKSPRDFMVVVFFCFFLLLGSFLYDQAITTFIFMLILTILLISAMLRLNLIYSHRPPKRYLMKTASRYLLVIIPIAICLFLFFPRTRGFFFGFRSAEATIGTSGVKDHMYPGRVARTAQSNATAFRVFFPDQNRPAYKDLYFRALVLWFTDGREWFQGRFRSRPAQNDPSPSRSIRQEIIMEPHNQYWLPALDTPHIFPRWSQNTTGQIMRIPRRLNGHLRYRVTSTPNYQRSDTLHRILRRYALQVPRRGSTRLKNLVAGWASTGNSPRQVIQSALNFFKNNGFTYSLQPGELSDENPLEDFIFRTRTGFCEHYAAAFTLMMRMADIPARVVIGYHGGKYHEVGKYLIVRQMDAHAWTEVWLEGEGWQRVDVTYVVSPTRVEMGIEYSDDLASRLAAESGDQEGDLSRRNRGGFFRRTIRWFEDIWETIKIQWSYWIMSYDRFQQWNFLRFLGFLKDSALGLIVTTIALVFFIILIVKTLLRRETRTTDPVVRLYHLFCHKLAGKNLARLAWEGPLDYGCRVADALPAKAVEISKITQLYIDLRYGQVEASQDQMNVLKQKVKRFSP